MEPVQHKLDAVDSFIPDSHIERPTVKVSELLKVLITLSGDMADTELLKIRANIRRPNNSNIKIILDFNPFYGVLLDVVGGRKCIHNDPNL